MNYFEFLNEAINKGIDAAKKDYCEKKDENFLAGSIAGFEACRDKLPEDLVKAYNDATTEVNKAYFENKENYWWYKCFQSEVEWICNVVSAVLVNEGQDALLPWLPTANAMMNAAAIIGTNKE